MLVTMSNKELHRLPVIQAVIEKRLRRRDAASQLDLTERQVQRLMNRYRESGAAGLTDARRGKPGTHRIDESLRHHILTLLRENYVGFAHNLPQKCFRYFPKLISSLLHPVFQHQTRYPRKFPGIICHQYNAGRNGMTGNSRVIWAYRCSGCA
jgi:hypothetical protein